MFIIDWFLSIADFIEEIRHGKRYGFGGFLWKLATFVCIFLAVLFFYLEWKIPGILAIGGTVVCFVCSCCRSVRDVRKKATESAGEKT